MRSTFIRLLAACVALLPCAAAEADPEHDRRLANAAAVLDAFTADEAAAIPAELLDRAHGVAVIPNLIRGGFLLGGRRGRGVLSVRTPEGGFSNPAMITLTGGSIGWQFGAESADLVLVFANARSVRNIEDGKFTLGGDATAVAGPVGRRSTAALTGRAEVYAYFRSRGLFAGAAFEGARLDVDEQRSALFYAADPRARAFGSPSDATPPSARRFLATLDRAARLPAPQAAADGAPGTPTGADGGELRTFPLGGAP